MRRHERYGAHFAVDKRTQNKMRCFFVKTTADVRHTCSRTISKTNLKKNEFPEVNFYDKKKSSDYISFTDVFEFSSDSKKTSDFTITLVLLMFLSFFSSHVRSEVFL